MTSTNCAQNYIFKFRVVSVLTFLQTSLAVWYVARHLDGYLSCRCMISTCEFHHQCAIAVLLNSLAVSWACEVSSNWGLRSAPNIECEWFDFYHERYWTVNISNHKGYNMSLYLPIYIEVHYILLDVSPACWNILRRTWDATSWFAALRRQGNWSLWFWSEHEMHCRSGIWPTNGFGYWTELYSWHMLTPLPWIFVTLERLPTKNRSLWGLNS